MKQQPESLSAYALAIVLGMAALLLTISMPALNLLFD